MAVLLFFFTIFLCVVTINEACWCTQAHPQSRFCSADFAIRAKVLNESWDNSSRIYTLKVFKAFKGGKKIERVAEMQSDTGKRRKNVVQVTTELDSAACGVRLQISKIYILLGYVENQHRRPYKGKKKLTIESCQWHSLWNDTTAQQRRGLKRIYGKYCLCNIDKYCFKERPELCKDLIQGCHLQGSDDRMKDCRAKHSYCVKGRKKCRWIAPQKADLKKCMNA